MDEDGSVDAVQPGPESFEQRLLEVAAIVDKGMQFDEDSLPMPQTNEIVLPTDEIEAAGSVLLCIAGFLNGIAVTF